VTAVAKCGNVFGKIIQPVSIEPVVGIDQQRGADLYDQASQIIEHKFCHAAMLPGKTMVPGIG